MKFLQINSNFCFGSNPLSCIQGKESSDEEEVDDVPDDDQYDTEDSFIDDSELVCTS